MKKKWNLVLQAGLPTFNQLSRKQESAAKGKDRLRGDGLKVSNVYLDIGYYSLSTLAWPLKISSGIGQKGMVNLLFRFNLLISSFI
jgi:hypothetical protein